MQFGRVLVVATSLFVAASIPVSVAAETTHHRHKKVEAQKDAEAPHKTESVKKSATTAKAHHRAERTAKAAVPEKKADTRKVAAHARETKASARPRRTPVSYMSQSGGPRLRSAAYLVQDLQTGEILLQKNAEDVQPMASLTKLMTAMVVLDAKQNMDEVLEVTDDDVDRLKNSVSHLTVGSRLTRREMLHLALMASENRAASALARNYPGGMHAFLLAANAKAQKLGLRSTHYYDPTGLNKDNVSSAKDLAVIVATAARYPLIHEFSTSTEQTVELKGGTPRAFHNTDALVKSSRWNIDVSKTGHINESGQCLVIKTRLVSRNLAIVLLNSQSTSSRVEDAIKVRNWLESTSGDVGQSRSGSRA